MTLDIDDELVPKVRTLIDEVAHDIEEDFSTDLNAEIRLAIILAAQKMKRDIPREFILPVAASTEGKDPVVIEGSDDGTGTITLPDDFGEVVELQMNGWTQPVTEFIDPGTDEAKQQQHVWTRGNYNKPKAMIVLNAKGDNVIRYFTARKDDEGVYDHTLDHFVYEPVIDDSTAYLPIANNMYDALIYQAASILMLSKGETAMAQQFAAMGSTDTPETVTPAQ